MTGPDLGKARRIQSCSGRASIHRQCCDLLLTAVGA